jgi:hypothetical protein
MTKCYTYEIKLLIQVLAENKDAADDRLEKEGGYVSRRDVEFISETQVWEDPLEVAFKAMQEESESIPETE